MRTHNEKLKTANLYLFEIYDYLIAWKTSNITNMQFENIFQHPVTGSGVILNSAMNFTINSGVTLSKGTKFKSVVTTGSLSNSGTIDVDGFQSSEGIILKLEIFNIVVGSRVQIYNSTTTTEIANFVATNSTYTLTYLNDKSKLSNLFSYHVYNYNLLNFFNRK